MLDLFREKMMKSLEDAEVQSRIAAIVAQKLTGEGEGKKVSSEGGRVPTKILELKRGENSKTEAENQKLKLEIADLQHKLEERAKTETEVRRLESDLASLRNERDAAKKISDAAQKELLAEQRKTRTLQREVDGLREFGVDRYRKVFDSYQALPKELRKSLDGFFHARDLASFVFNGVQPENFRKFWDFCRCDLARGRLSAHREVLLELFDFFFDLINLSLGSGPMWTKQTVEVGCQFDVNKHSSVVPGAKIKGVVEKVIWPGILYANNHEVCKGALVLVK